MDLNMLCRVREYVTESDHCEDLPAGLNSNMFGPYLTISKDFTVSQNFKVEPYIRGCLFFGTYEEIVDNIFPYIGLRLKYGFSSKKELQQKK